MQPIQTLREFASTEERGVSSVIGVVLMVAVAVILAAVIASFALGIGNQTEDTTPNVQLDVEEKIVDITDRPTNVVVFKHQSGKAIDASNLKVEVNGKKAFDMTNDGKIVEVTSSDSSVFNGGEYKVGNKIRVVLHEVPNSQVEKANSVEDAIGQVDYSDSDGDSSCSSNPDNTDYNPPSVAAFDKGGGVSLACSATIHQGDTVRILFTGGDGNPGVITSYELDEPAA